MLSFLFYMIVAICNSYYQQRIIIVLILTPESVLILSLLIEREKAHLIYRRTLSRNLIND